MHQCQEYIRDYYIIGIQNAGYVQNKIMTAVHAKAIESRLSHDAVSYFYSSAISFADAIRGLEQGFYSWATVKMYYSVFYSFRSILACKNACVFYVGSTPYSLSCVTGRHPSKEKGNTHNVILNLFSKKLTNHILLSQEIELETPCDWLNKKRNQANYYNARFPEPDTPLHFSNIVQNGARKNLAFYESDVQNLYTFDKDHSMVSYPLRVLYEARKLLAVENMYNLDDQSASYLRGLVKDKNGVIPSFSKVMEGT